MAAASESIGPLALEGRAVRLEPLTMGHIPGLLVAASEDRETYGWTLVPEDEAAMRAYVEEALELAAQGAAVPFATLDAGSGRIVGSTRFANFEYLPWPGMAGPGERAPDGVEIGWTWLASSVLRSAINTEAKLLMLRHAFEGWGARVVRLKTDRRNARSRAAIERIGGRLDGVLRAHTVGRDGALRDTAYYSIIESEWPAVRASLEERVVRR